MNRTCTATGECCPEKCLGGCFYPDPLVRTNLTCFACKKFVYQNRCVDKCPNGTYGYLGRRCITKEECHTKKKSFNDDDVKKQYKAFNNECEYECPVGYTEDPSNHKKCNFCGDSCPKICTSSLISDIGSVQKLKGCTIINGSLEIALRGGGSMILFSKIFLWGFLI